MRILVTEDDSSIQLIICRQLQKWGFEVITAADGQQALDIVHSEQPPDIIIMDWMMPGLDGLEACSQIKSDEKLPMIYIIMLTSRSNKDDIIAGLDSGADDFLTKPVSSGELHSRLRVAERTVGYERRLREYAHEMEELAAQRAQQLVHADRLVTIGTMASGIVHEINNPLSAISGSSQVIEKYWENVKPLVEKALGEGCDDGAILELILKEFPEMVSGVRESCSRISNIVRNLRKFYRNSGGHDLEMYSVGECIDSSVRVCRPKLTKQIEVVQEIPENPPAVRVCPQELDQVLVNLLVNAAEAIQGGSGKGVIRIGVSQSAHKVTISVFNNGPLIDEDTLQRIWQSFYTTKDDGTGLGLAISRDIIKSFGGEINAANLPGGDGVVFTITLPALSVFG